MWREAGHAQGMEEAQDHGGACLLYTSAAPWAVLLLLSGGGASANVWNSPGGIAVLCAGAGVCVIAYLAMKAIGRLSSDPRNLGGTR